MNPPRSLPPARLVDGPKGKYTLIPCYSGMWLVVFPGDGRQEAYESEKKARAAIREDRE